MPEPTESQRSVAEPEHHDSTARLLGLGALVVVLIIAAAAGYIITHPAPAPAQGPTGSNGARGPQGSPGPQGPPGNATGAVYPGFDPSFTYGGKTMEWANLSAPNATCTTHDRASYACSLEITDGAGDVEHLRGLTYPSTLAYHYNGADPSMSQVRFSAGNTTGFLLWFTVSSVALTNPPALTPTITLVIG